MHRGGVEECAEMENVCISYFNHIDICGGMLICI